MKFSKYLPALREVSRRGKGERSRRLADIMVFDEIGVESSLLLSGEFLVLLFRDKRTTKGVPQYAPSFYTSQSNCHQGVFKFTYSPQTHAL